MRGEGPDSLRNQAFHLLTTVLGCGARVVAIAGRLDQVSTFKTLGAGVQFGLLLPSPTLLSMPGAVFTRFHLGHKQTF
jgi:hypothetical protein